MANYCTLFDSGYLDRGIALYQSLEKVSKDFCLYIFCVDEIAYNILKRINHSRVVLVKEEEFLDDQLRQIRTERSRAEYCWSCTPRIIEYVLDRFEVGNCTYIDADMLFYSDPNILVNAIPEEDSVSIIGHRYANNFAKKNREKKYGKYCVEFNTFKNNDSGRLVLKWWKEKCYEACSMDADGETYGDQKYLDDFQNKFEGVYVQKHLGAGVAPWNVSDYTLINERGTDFSLKHKNGDLCPLIFFHFQGLNVLTDTSAHIAVYNELGRMDENLIKSIYVPYVKELLFIRKWVKEEYGHEISVYGKKKYERMAFKNLRDTITYILVCLTIIYRGKRNIIEMD